MENNYISVTALNKYLKYKFDEDSHLQHIYLKGEISNFKPHSRGHYYFTLKDEMSRINAVMFSSKTSTLKFQPQDGMKVLAIGRISVYEPSGGYQIYVEDLKEDGLGNLYIAFEQLKEKLSKEGLFNQKRSITKMPTKIGIITAPTGAAIKDILTTIKRRYPICETILFPSLVQGREAANDIVRNIKLANEYDLDTLIIGRGGGSIEDLWSFNEEIVARAIYESKIPTISAVGHEIDFTIADFVADLRAPTPTAAAELAVPSTEEIINYLNNVKTRSYNSVTSILKNKKLILNKLQTSYVLTNPSNMYEIKEQKLDNLIDKLNTNINNIMELNKVRLFKSVNSYVLNNPELLYKFKKQNLDNVISKLEVLNPLNTLKRGYSIVRSKDKVITSVKDINVASDIALTFQDGEIKATVKEIGG